MSSFSNILNFIQGRFGLPWLPTNVTVIPDGDDQPRTNQADGEIFVLGRGDSTTVDGAPVLTVVDDRVTFLNKGSAETTGDTATVDLQGDRATVKNFSRAEIVAEETAIEVSGTGARIHNDGTIDGGFNGVNFVNGGESSGALLNYGVVSSDSRAVNIGGSDIDVLNYGHILGTGDQRNGTIYSDGTAEDFKIVNARHAVIDAGEGNDGAGIALQTGDVDGDVVEARVINHGTIEGRGQAAADTGQAGDGIRIFSGVDGGGTTFEGDILNSGKVLSESEVGPTSAIRFSDGLSFDGKVVNAHGGLIDGANNGLYFGDAEHDAKVLNYGTIQSDSRAVNIDGSGVDLHNFGRILGTDDQRNGTVYSDATADDYSILNARYAVIDAGKGNDGAGVALQTGEVDGDVVEASVTNRGTIEGRGRAAANTGQAGDGIRIFSGVEGGGTAFKGDLFNSGKILSESEVGPTSAIRFSDGLSFDGKVTNARGGLIDGANNGLYFGDADHKAKAVNHGTIQSDSRAVNIDGTGVDLDNFGRILGTDDQRNGTVYSDATADDYSIFNALRGVIDAGDGNEGAGIALQTGEVADDVVHADIVNRGTIEGRGQAAANTGLAGDGIRIFSGVEGGGTTFKGDIFNSGKILSESEQGPTSAVRFSDGLGFEGTITNARNGLIDGANNGLYFGNSEHDAQAINHGTIQSDSRAVNIDGSGVEVENYGRILGTGDQRNGTVYSDATAEEFSVTNHRQALIDAGRGNDGAGVSFQVGDADGDVVEAELVNYGTIIGRGDGAGNLTGDGVRLFTGAAEVQTVFDGDIVNGGRILSEEAAGIRLSADVALDGEIRNDGLIKGAVGIDATENDTGVTIINRGTIEGDVLLGSGNDVFDGDGGQVDGDINGGAGNDTLTAGDETDTFVFDLGTGSDTVANYDTDEDLLDVGAFFGSQAAALAAARQDGGDTVIDLDTGAGDEVRLIGVDVGDLQTDNFII